MIDSLVILGDNIFGETLSAIACRDGAAALGIASVVAAPARAKDYSLVNANDRLATHATTDAAIWQLARVDPHQGAAALSELRRCQVELGCVGLFLNPDEEVFRIQDAEEIVRYAAVLDLPVVVVAGIPLRSEPLQILELARKVPEAELILTSGGQVNITGLGMIDAWAALTRSPRISVLTNGEYRQDYLERIVRELGPERLQFGSAAPYYDQAFELKRILNVGYSATELELVLSGNARRVFGG